MSVRAASHCVLKMPRVLTCQDHTHALVTMDSQGMELSHVQVNVLAKDFSAIYKLILPTQMSMSVLHLLIPVILMHFAKTFLEVSFVNATSGTLELGMNAVSSEITCS